MTEARAAILASVIALVVAVAAFFRAAEDRATPDDPVPVTPRVAEPASLLRRIGQIESEVERLRQVPKSSDETAFIEPSASRSPARGAVVLMFDVGLDNVPLVIEPPVVVRNDQGWTETTYCTLRLPPGLRVLLVEKARTPTADWYPLHGWEQTSDTLRLVHRRYTEFSNSESTRTEQLGSGLLRVWAVESR